MRTPLPDKECFEEIHLTISCSHQGKDYPHSVDNLGGRRFENIVSMGKLERKTKIEGTDSLTVMLEIISSTCSRKIWASMAYRENIHIENIQN